MVTGVACKLDLILVILSTKNVLKASASCWLVFPGGRGRSLFLPKRVLHMLKTFLKSPLFSHNRSL